MRATERRWNTLFIVVSLLVLSGSLLLLLPLVLFDEWNDADRPMSKTLANEGDFLRRSRAVFSVNIVGLAAAVVVVAATAAADEDDDDDDDVLSLRSISCK